MCRTIREGGRRCQHKNPLGRVAANLQAQKQYNQKHHPEKVQAIQERLNTTNRLKNLWGTYTHPHTMKLSENTLKVIHQLEQAGLQPYIVGGSVRDSLSGLESKDIDIEVYGGSADKIIETLKNLGSVDEVGKSFGVLKMAYNGEDYDISLPRKETKTSDSHTGFEVEVDPELTPFEASTRRDFTFNALMYSPTHKVIVDYHNGVKDWEDRVLKPVSEAFKEDPLRVIRGVQMASRFKATLHPETIQISRELKTQFPTISKERIQTEFQKTYFKGQDAAGAYKALKETQWDENFPGLSPINNEQLWSKLSKMEQKVFNKTTDPTKTDVFLNAVVVAHLPEKDRKNFVDYTLLTDKKKSQALVLVNSNLPENPTDEQYRHFARSLKQNITVDDVLSFKESLGEDVTGARIVASRTGVLQKMEADWVSGNDVLALTTQKPGPWLGKLLDELRSNQYSRNVSNREQLLSEARKLLQ